jgi:tetratricopeptide (TPR) repeat protein
MLLGRRELIPSMIRKLFAKNSAERARAAFILGQTGSRKSIPHLAGSLHDPSRAVRIQSAIALASLGDRRGISRCSTILKTGAPWMRYYAVCGLWRINSKESRAALRSGMRGQGEFISSTIRMALSMPFTSLASPLKPARWMKNFPAERVIDEACAAYCIESDWWWEIGDYEQAIRCHEVEVFLDPKYVDGYMLIAWLEWSLGRDDAAVSTLKRGIAASPRNPDAYFWLGEHYMGTHRYLLARRYLNRSVELGGDHLARRAYAHCLEKLGEFELARDQWQILLKIKPNDPVIRRNYDRLNQIINSLAQEDR